MSCNKIFFFLTILSLSSVLHANEISILSPQDNTVLTEPNVPITISVTDSTQIERVTYDWFYGGLIVRQKGSIGETSTAPYDFNFVATTLENNTNYNIVACAYLITGGDPVCDVANNLSIQHPEPTLVMRSSFYIRIIRGTPPPEEPQLPSFPVWENQVTLGAFSSDADGISSVKFYVDEGALIGEATQSATNESYYTLVWDTTLVKNGLHRVYVKSTDNTGLTSKDDPNEVSRGSFYIENHYIPTNVYGRAKNYHVNVTWEGNEQDLAYAVYRRLDTEADFTYMGNTEGTVWVDDMPVGTAYAEYYVKSVYLYGLSDPSEIITVRPAFRSR